MILCGEVIGIALHTFYTCSGYDGLHDGLGGGCGCGGGWEFMRKLLLA